MRACRTALLRAALLPLQTLRGCVAPRPLVALLTSCLAALSLRAGVVVAADSAEAAAVAAANRQYAEAVAARVASGRCSSTPTQTLVLLRKQREVQSGSSDTSDAACQASSWELQHAYVAQGGTAAVAAEDLSAVLPWGPPVAAGAAALQLVRGLCMPASVAQRQLQLAGDRR